MNNSQQDQIEHLQTVVAGLASRMNVVETQLKQIRRFLGPMGLGVIEIDEVLMHPLPGGKAPERKTDGAIGFDVYCRAIVSPDEMDEENSLLRKPLFDFYNEPEDPFLRERVIRDENGNPIGMRFHQGDAAVIGVGFRTAMPLPMFFWLAPRSGLAMRGISLSNTPGTIDPDYRGEAGALLVNHRSKEPFDLYHNQRIAQVIFSLALIPKIKIVADGELPETIRGPGGFGSTGDMG